MTNRNPRERFVIERQINPRGRRSFYSNMTFTTGNVPGRVLDIIKSEILLHMPSLFEHYNEATIDETVDQITKRLARAEDFDFDASMEADQRWQRGMFIPKGLGET